MAASRRTARHPERGPADGRPHPRGGGQSRRQRPQNSTNQHSDRAQQEAVTRMTQPQDQPSHGPCPEESLGRVHFIGIGGVGMSAVARILVARGLPVSGSDAKDLPVMAELAAAGARIAVGYARRPTSATPRPWSPAPRSGRTTPNWQPPAPPGCRYCTAPRRWPPRWRTTPSWRSPARTASPPRRR